MGDVYPCVSSRVQGARPLPFHYDVMVMQVLLIVKQPINHLYLSFYSAVEKQQQL
jgi:hypothetical protein